MLELAYHIDNLLQLPESLGDGDIVSLHSRY